MSGTRERISIAQAFGGMWEAYHRMVIKTASYTHEQTGRTSLVPRPSPAPVFGGGEGLRTRLGRTAIRLSFRFE